MDLTTYLYRGLNLLLRSRGHRAASQYTSVWGLTRIAEKSPENRYFVVSNLAKRALEGKVTPSQLEALPRPLAEDVIRKIPQRLEGIELKIKKAVQFAVEMREDFALEILFGFIVRATGFHYATVDDLTSYLNSGYTTTRVSRVGSELKPVTGLSRDARSVRDVHWVMETWYERKHAQTLLRGIRDTAKLDGMRDRIMTLLSSAPPVERPHRTYGPWRTVEPHSESLPS